MTSLIAPLIAFSGVLVGLLWNGWLQRRTETRQREQVEMAARATIYA